VALLTSAGVTVLPDFVNGGHNWYAQRFNPRTSSPESRSSPGWRVGLAVNMDR
jgi:hypothetical protein